MADRKKMREFVEKWAGRGYEKGDTQQFWLQLLRAIEYPHADDVLFEHRLPSGGFIDVWIRDADVLIEQKSLEIDLDKEEMRQSKLKTPLMQALDYVEELPRLQQPRYVVTCNFGTFRVYDRDKWSKSELVSNAFEFKLDELAEHPEYLTFIVDPSNSRLDKEKQVSIQAGAEIGKLYDRLREGYIDPDSEESMHALNVLCVRLVFCLYCEDADLFPKDAFYNYLHEVTPVDIRDRLKKLFRALDTPIAERDPYDMAVKPFPYVNGGLFRDETEVPNFDAEMKRFLLEEVSASVNWSHISPTIFGGIFESTLNPETRRSGGMHYTSPENIHKVIDPLFLDDLKAEFAAIRDEEGATPRKKKMALTRFHSKLCGLKFFDPACGSGNFLTETYICLRKLEDSVLSELNYGQSAIDFEESGPTQRVSLDQFYGIEINDFAVTVAETALWISRLKANGETSMLLSMGDDDFPLHESAHIVHGNALRTDWNEVLPASQCSYIMGNPPFVGHQWRTKEQQDDMQTVFEGWSKFGKLDYVAAWYAKAVQYIANWRVKCAFVSTNSISQGEPVKILWKPLFDSDIEIDFAYQAFIWNSEASIQAHVHVVIVGFSKRGTSSGNKRLYLGERCTVVNHINAYLLPADDVFVESRGKNCNHNAPTISKGSQPTDGGNLILDKDEADSFRAEYPELAGLVHPFVGAREFLNGQYRYCFYLKGSNIESALNNDVIRVRLAAVKNERSKSPTKQVRDCAETPWLFTQDRQPTTDFLVLPKTTSGRRMYVPVGFMKPDVIVSDKLHLIANADLYLFGLLCSRAHNAWIRVVSGRLKSDYEYAPAVYNSFVWPEPTDEQRQTIEACAQAVLDARDNHSDDSLATLYDPDKMPDDLLAAHKALDAAVEAAYGVDFDGDEEKIVAHLFKLYAEKTAQK